MEVKSMIEFIVKYWLEILFTTITTGVLYMLKEYIGVKSGVKALQIGRAHV